MKNRAAIYARVSTSDQSCERQVAELTAFAERGGYDVVGMFKETASGASANRAARNQILNLAQARHIDAILVSELSRWGRSTQDLLDTLNRLAGWKVSVVAMNGMTFELDTPHGRMMATMLAGIAQFERDLLSERVKSGLAAARARGKKLGRQPGQRPKSDKLAPKVLQAVQDGKSYRWIARDLGISKNTVTDIVKTAQRSRLGRHLGSAPKWCPPKPISRSIGARPVSPCVILSSPTAPNAPRRSPRRRQVPHPARRRHLSVAAAAGSGGDGLPSPYPARQQVIPEEDSEDLFSYFHGHRRHLPCRARITAWHSNRNT